MTMNAGTSLRADALTPTLPSAASEGAVGWATAKRLALVPVMLNHVSAVVTVPGLDREMVPAIDVLLAEARKTDVDASGSGVFLRGHDGGEVAELPIGPAAAVAPLPPHLPDWYCHRSASSVLTTRERVSSLANPVT
jgi:hypothetical protein